MRTIAAKNFRPVILKKGIWHEVVTLADETEIKLTENANITKKRRSKLSFTEFPFLLIKFT